MSPADTKFDLDENYHKEVNKQGIVACIFIKNDLYGGGSGGHEGLFRNKQEVHYIIKDVTSAAS